MSVWLKTAGESDFAKLYDIRISAFLPLYERYHDDETSPVKESLDAFAMRMRQPDCIQYMILYYNEAVGFIRLKSLSPERLHVSEICVSPECQGLGIAQKVFAMVEELYPNVTVWELSTIMQEKRNCYLYEKLGYKRLNKTKNLNEHTTLVYYEKNINPAN